MSLLGALDDTKAFNKTDKFGKQIKSVEGNRSGIWYNSAVRRRYSRDCQGKCTFYSLTKKKEKSIVSCQ